MSNTNLSPVPATLREKVRKLVELSWFQNLIIGVILLNAITLGLDTSPEMVTRYGVLLDFFDTVALAIFVVELLLRIFAHRGNFFRDPWSLFDLLIVGISFLPDNGVFSILRILRILRVLRIIELVPSMRLVVESLLSAMPGMSAVSTLLVMFTYIASVIVTKVFGEAAPEQFGTLGRSIASLVQFMTLDGGWDKVNAGTKSSPYAWIFFIFFLMTTTFTLLNLFVGVIVSAMQERVRAEKALKAAQGPASGAPVTVGDIDQVLAAIAALKTEVQDLKSQIKRP